MFYNSQEKMPIYYCNLKPPNILELLVGRQFVDMDVLKYKTRAEEGDTVVIYLDVKHMYSIVLNKNEVLQTVYGALKHDDLIGCEYGTRVNCSRGWAYLLYLTPELWTMTLPHRTQILYTPDISIIVMQLDLRPGSIVCEAGTGSGSLSHALARAISPNGFLHTYDFHLQRVEVVQKEFESHGLQKVISVQQRDVATSGFNLSNHADAIFLDLPRPWDVIVFAAETIKFRGRICSFSPCIEQVQRTCAALQEHKFEEIKTIECVQRKFDVKKVSAPVINLSIKDDALDNSNHVPDRVEEPMGMDCALNESNGSSICRDQKKKQMQTSTEEKNIFWAAVAHRQITSHTGYLTFATYSVCKNPSNKDVL